jgi:hypothetical protein
MRPVPLALVSALVATAACKHDAPLPFGEMKDSDLQRLTQLCPVYVPQKWEESGVDAMVPETFEARIHDPVRFTCRATEPRTRCKAQLELWRDRATSIVLRFSLDVRCPHEGASEFVDQLLPLAMDPWQHVMPAGDVRALYKKAKRYRTGPHWSIDATVLPPDPQTGETDVGIAATMSDND